MTPVLVLFSIAAPAQAHVGHVILRAERYLKLDVAGNDARVVVSLTLGADEGRRVLDAADANGDGDVNAPEADAYLAQWALGLATELPIFVESQRVELTWADGYFEPIGTVRRTPLTIEMVAHLELEGEQTVRVEDRMVRREVFDRTDVAFRTRDGARLLTSGVEGEADDPTTDLSYPGTFREGAESVPLVARVWTPPIRPAPFWSRAPWWSGPALAVGLLLVIGLVVRSARRR